MSTTTSTPTEINPNPADGGTPMSEQSKTELSQSIRVLRRQTGTAYEGDEQVGYPTVDEGVYVGQVGLDGYATVRLADGTEVEIDGGWQTVDEDDEDDKADEIDLPALLASALGDLLYADADDLPGDLPDLASALAGVDTFAEVGMMTMNDGLVLHLADGSEFQLTIVRSR